MDNNFHTNLIVSSSPHIVTESDTTRLMGSVLLALAPAWIASIYIFGLRALLLCNRRRHRWRMWPKGAGRARLPAPHRRRIIPPWPGICTKKEKAWWRSLWQQTGVLPPPDWYRVPAMMIWMHRRWPLPVGCTVPHRRPPPWWGGFRWGFIFVSVENKVFLLLCAVFDTLSPHPCAV